MNTNFISLVFHRSIVTSVASLICCFILISYLSNAYYGPPSLKSIPTTKTTSKDIGCSCNTSSSPLPRTMIKPKDDTNNISVNVNTEMPARPSHEISKCDIFDGRWVYDDKTYPMYKSSQCPFLSDQVRCRKNGRPDHDYEKWRWEAKDCKIPRFNGTDMLERLRGKRVVIVGDSLNRNQWESLACLLYSSIPSESAYVDTHNHTFIAKEYDCTVEFYMIPFLVELDKTKPEKGIILKIDKLPAAAQNWQGASIMVFNTGHWWLHNEKWDLVEYKGKVVENLTNEKALEIAMKTWGGWIDQHIDPTKTSVLFRTFSPTHGRKNWCYNQTQPIMDESFEELFPKSFIKIIQERIRKMKTPVKYLDITKLSEYRKDAHPSVYTTKGGVLLTEEQRKQPKKFGDCNHWCIPGLPDTWNQLLYISIFHDASSDVLQIPNSHS